VVEHANIGLRTLFVYLIWKARTIAVKRSHQGNHSICIRDSNGSCLFERSKSVKLDPKLQLFIYSGRYHLWIGQSIDSFLGKKLILFI
jgi:hypothetical protein